MEYCREEDSLVLYSNHSLSLCPDVPGLARALEEDRALYHSSLSVGSSIQSRTRQTSNAGSRYLGTYMAN